MSFKDLRQKTGLNIRQFAQYFDIPERTVQNWEYGYNRCPPYLMRLLNYVIDREF